MSVWTEHIENAGLPVLTQQVREKVEAGVASDGVEQDHLDRTNRVVEQVEWVVENVDPTLFRSNTVDGFVLNLTAMSTHLDSWRAGAGPAELLTEVAAAVDETLRLLGEIPVPTSAAEASQEIGSLRRSVGQHRHQMKREVQALTEQVAAALTELEDYRLQATESFAVHQAEVAATVGDLTAEVLRVRDEVTMLLTSARTLETNQQATFGQTLTSNQEAFANLLAESRAELTAANAEAVNATNRRLAEFEALHEIEIVSARERTAEIQQLFASSGETTLIGRHTRNANRERRAADLWRWIAIAGAVAAAGIGVWAAIVAAGAGSDWDLLGSKVVLAALVAGTAAYAASQSSEHRQAQRHAEHVAVQTTTLNSYRSDRERGRTRQGPD